LVAAFEKKQVIFLQKYFFFSSSFRFKEKAGFTMNISHPERVYTSHPTFNPLATNQLPYLESASRPMDISI